MDSRRLLLGLFAAAALAAAGLARADDKPVSLARTCKAGDTALYRMQVTANANGTEVPATLTVKRTVKEVKPGGDVVLLEEEQGGKYTLNGVDQDLPADVPAIITLSKLGKVTSFATKSGEGGGFIALPVRQLRLLMSEVVLPPKAVAPGETWETEYDNPVAKGKKVVAKGKFVGLDKVDGADLWKIEQTSEGIADADGNVMTAACAYWLDPATGSIVKGQTEEKGVPTQYGQIDFVTKITVAKPGDESKKDAR